MIPFTQEAGAALLEELSVDYPQLQKLNPEFVPVQHQGLFLEVEPGSEKFRLSCNTVAAAGRGLGMALSGESGQEHAPFDLLAVMLDVSRNFVPELSWLKRLFRRLALLGFNCVMLYTEDTYQLDGEPFFGYLRGGYTLEELRELDRTARRLGIELVGCIQTLGHLEQVLKWNRAYQPVTDTPRVLLADVPETGNLLRKMIGFWSQALSSRRIHIGMDETHDLGRGKFIDYHGFEAPFELFNRHLGKVNEICKKHGVAPLIWSDMYFRLSNPEQNYYDFTSPIPESVQKKIPKNVQLVYWDYYHEDAESYEKMIRRHRDIGFEPVMGSGIWTWTRMWYDHEKTRSTVIPCIEACRKMKVQELFFTMWGDDGAYCNYDSALAGLVYSADLAFGVKPDDTKTTAARFAATCGSSFQANITAGGIQATLTAGDKKYTVSPSMLIWDDPLMGIYFDECLRHDPEFDLKITDHYDEMLRKLLPHQDDKAAGDFEHIINALDLLIQKTEMRSALIDAYANDDRIALRQIAVSVIPSVIAAAQEFDASFRTQWLDCAKPFGLETIQIRNAGLIARLDETALRIREYLDGVVAEIDELEAQAEPCDIFNNPNWYHGVCSGTGIH